MKKTNNEKIYKDNEKKCPSTEQGFSLIEVLFSLLVLSAGTGAILTLMASNIKNSNTAKYQVIASELAQEGVELVKNLKDNRDRDLTASKFTNDIFGNDYRIDFDSTYDIFKNSNSVATNKRLNLSAGNFYVHAPATPTKFFRKIAVSRSIDGNGKITANVTSFVSWNGVDIPTPCSVANKCTEVVAVLPDLN